MQYIEFREYLKDFTVFSLSDIRRIAKDFHRRRLSEWQNKEYIKKVIKGHYVFGDLALNENSLFEIANKIYNPSYISFETALAYYGLIPESVYGIISASTRRTYVFKTGMAEFSFKTIKPQFFFGYNLIKYNNKVFKIASPEKAVIDYLYIHTALNNKDDFASLRINKAAFSKLINKTKLFIFLEKFNKNTLTRRTRAFLEFIKHAGIKTNRIFLS